jgi:hypothetical protein
MAQAEILMHPQHNNELFTLVTLVHGTFDRHARWTKPDSLVCRRLQTAVEKLHIAPFDWSGLNSYLGRELAASDLADHIAYVTKRYPASRHFLIGHSHGGNLIKWALE